MLRMSEFERIREVVYQVDVWLPEGSPVLLVHVRITNPGAAEVPMYWWTNIAVPQCPDVRVLAPADAAWHFDHHRRLRRVPVPDHEGLDRTYPARAGDAADYFFAIDERPAAMGGCPGRRGPRARPDVDPRSARPQAVPVGLEPRWKALAGLALRLHR